MDQKSNFKKQLVRSTSAQIRFFVDYMAMNKDFANSQGEYTGVVGVRKANKEWEALREKLKELGSDKSIIQWKQTWRDLKRKARKAVRINKTSMPIVSDATFKVLETIGPAGLDCSIEIQNSEEMQDWSINYEENSVLTQKETENNNSRNSFDEESDRSLEADISDLRDESPVVEVIVPLPEIQHTGSNNKPQHDPLQTIVTSRQPRLAPKLSRIATPPPIERASASFGLDSCPPSITRRKQTLLMTRKRNTNTLKQASIEFVLIEQRRLKLEEERDRRLHEREMERLKLELQKIEVQRNQNELLQHLVTIAQNAYELLQQKLQ